MTALIGKIFGSLKDNEITINVGYRYGWISESGFLHVNRRMISPSLRMPNTRVWVHFDEKGEVISVVPLSPEDHRIEEEWERNQEKRRN